MGISGLLPLLKSIQVNKHLSEFGGQTLAVDAYVWLHRGVYACATEIATGKKTTKYVDYAMHRVRLLRHHNIQPYIVFDGGPLPAKKGTESERKQRRDENLAKANALAAQGKHSQAREYYVKCADVTPQMAYQLIKALRAEGVSYVVAPYEADAQMAYLERIGMVDGIITEDSDLLVFGCRTVLFKLDSVSNTITSISRADFASVTADDGGISLLGWSDTQFRAMAILSGCDYLPSIPGIGLKTAWSLLRKYKTVDQVIRSVRLEGKKMVPKGYLEAYMLAEKVFLHQRVYCPLEERLVNLMQIPQGVAWDEKEEAYVGRDIDPSLAKSLARGDIDPVTLQPMIDINPAYIPRAIKRLPLATTDLNRPWPQDEGKGKAPVKSNSEGLLQFFTPKPKLSLSRSSSVPVRKTAVAGKGSGKRTLVDVMDDDLAAKRKKVDNPLCMVDADTPNTTASRFFGAAAGRRSVNGLAVSSQPKTGPVIIYDLTGDKESSADEIEEKFKMQEHLTEPEDPVTQEDGYLSPTHSYGRLDTPELSSPPRGRQKASVKRAECEDDFDADFMSSPVAHKSDVRQTFRKNLSLPSKASDRSQGFVPTFEFFVDLLPANAASVQPNGPDLRDMFDEITSDTDVGDDQPSPNISSSPSPELRTPEDGDSVASIDQLEVLDDDDLKLIDAEAQVRAKRNEIVAKGWWNKWAQNGKGEGPRHQWLRRQETTITPNGRETGFYARPKSAPLKNKSALYLSDMTVEPTRNLTFLQERERAGFRPRGLSRTKDAAKEPPPTNKGLPDRLKQYRFNLP